MDKATTMFEVALINAVRRYPCLYDTNMDRTRLILDMAWKAVAREIDVDIDTCRKRWKSLRDRFARYYTNPGIFDPWPLKEQMQFLEDFVLGDTRILRTKDESVSRNEISSHTTDTQETSQEGLDFVFENAHESQDVHITKEEYSIQTPEDNNTDNEFLTDNEANDEPSSNSFLHVNKQSATKTTKKRHLNDSKVNSSKKKKIFLSDLIGSDNNISMQKSKQNDPLAKYDTFIGTLNTYIGNRIKAEEEQSTNEEFFKVLDTYLMKLPESAQDELMAKILIKVLNKNQAD